MERRESRSDTAKALRVDIPGVVADDLSIARLARLAASSARTPDLAPVRTATVSMKVAAVAASVAVVSGGVAYAAHTFGGENAAPAPAPAPAAENSGPAEPIDGVRSRESDADMHDRRRMDDSAPRQQSDGSDGWGGGAVDRPDDTTTGGPDGGPDGGRVGGGRGGGTDVDPQHDDDATTDGPDTAPANDPEDRDAGDAAPREDATGDAPMDGGQGSDGNGDTSGGHPQDDASPDDTRQDDAPDDATPDGGVKDEEADLSSRRHDEASSAVPTPLALGGGTTTVV